MNRQSDAFHATLDDRDGVPQIGEAHARNLVFEVPEVPEIAVIHLQLQSLAGLQKHMEGCVGFRALLNLPEDPQLDRRTPVLAGDYLLDVHEGHLKSEEVVMVVQPVVHGEGLGRSRKPALRLALLLLLVDEALILSDTDPVLVRPLREGVGRIFLIIGDGSLLEA